MIKPIVINQFGEKIDFDTSFRIEEGMKLSEVSMFHVGCSGEIEIDDISDTHNGVKCSQCGRLPDPVAIPKSVNTIAKLRQWCARRMEAERAEQEKIRKIIIERAIYGC